MLDASAFYEFLNSPLGVALLALAVVVADRYAPPWVRQLLDLVGRTKRVPVASSAALVGGSAAAEPAAELAELLAAVAEHATHRWPAVHPDEAVERFTVDLRNANHYYRDQARKKEAEAAAEAAAGRAALSYNGAAHG